ncbi:hypothetical protein HPB47_006714 [Ixodes persulcatus]|uniref:Uncharacterized protein n=1 Tax=Ixodes persulcatus TaxID=34615 RepID=A0AC60PAF6_IXOPE|nr:hypothetical protein HPB47_006714 [Ixodes persulcatus]
MLRLGVYADKHHQSFAPSNIIHHVEMRMDHPEMKVVALWSLVLLLTLSSVRTASFQSSEVGNELQSPEVGEVSLVEKLGWDGGLDGGDDLEIAAAADDEKRAFHAMRGKKDDPSLDWDEADKRAFHAMRGKRLLAPASVDSFIAQLRRAVLQGKRGSGFFGMRGKRMSRTPGKEHPRSTFVATRGRRSVLPEAESRPYY